MNILFFLIPKSDVTFIYDDYTLKDALDKLENHSYTAIPIIDNNGRYVGTLTEGDMLWAIKNEQNINFYDAQKTSVSKIERKKDNQPVSVNSNMEDLISKAMSQNFVPVVDDDGIFIGIITRKDIIQYCYKKIKKMN